MKRLQTKGRKGRARELPSAGTSIDEKAIRLFEPDVLAAEEYRGTQRRRVLSSELELMAAVFEQGIADYRRYAFARHTKGRGLFLDAKAWLSSEEQDGVFSFTNCCDALGVAPNYVRGCLAGRQSMERVFPDAA